MASLHCEAPGGHVNRGSTSGGSVLGGSVLVVDDDAQMLRTINFITVILLPFGMLALGVLVWWNNRERGRASR